jgi:hypothetical protein
VRAARPLAALLAVAGAAGALVLIERGDGVDHPGEWDERVAELADWVEEARDLRFEHPVAVDFLTPDEYSDSIRGDEAELTDEDRDAIAGSESLLRAVGLADGELDLFETTNDVVDLGTLAYYDSQDERIVVRGTELTVDLRVTLVHELTHVVQDQHHDIDGLYEEAGDGALLAVRGLVEGDALRIEQRYVDEVLSDEERAEYDEATAAAVAESEADLDEAPPGYVAFFEAPYAFGEPFLLALDAERLVDDAFEDPPTSEEQLADPSRYVDDDDPTEVEPPSVDGEVLDQSTLGWVGWFLVLAERIDPFEALDALDGWDGDAYVLHEDGGATCVRADIAADDDEQRDEMLAAFERWASTLPAESGASAGRDGERLRVEVCDPGPDVDLGLTGRGADALVVPVIRSYAYGDALQVLDSEAARCYADDVVRRFTVEELADPEGAIFTDGRFQQAADQAFAACA